jgi:hypothetical protein
MLDKEGRVPYQTLPDDLAQKINLPRAVNEIALVNKSTGEVTYGVQSLLQIIGYSFPLLRPIFRRKAFVWTVDKLYKFISYNRKVIMPSSAYTQEALMPSFHTGYRLAFLLVAWLVTAAILTAYSKLLTGVIPVTTHFREFLVCGGQMAVQGIIVRRLNKQKLWDYLGSLMTVSLAGSIALLLPLLMAPLLHLSPQVYSVCFLVVAGLMFLEHARRVDVLGVSKWLSVSWVLYRCLLLLILIF